MEYVIVRQGDGKFVAPAGSAKSYTRLIAKARKFPTREAAQAEACGNECVREVW